MLSLAIAVALPALVVAQSSAPSGAAPSPPAPAAPTGPSVSFSIKSTNPTAVPLESINANEPMSATIPYATTESAGAQPTFLPGAPPLPNIVNISPQNYPPLDKYPPIDSPEVQQWIKEVEESGVPIPNWAPNVAGGCQANPQAAADHSRCWWSCTGCVRDTDITTCPDKYTWGSTFDDGPAAHTPNLLEYLDEHKIKTTFFVVGSRVLATPAALQVQYMGEHQIAIHTWSHAELTTLSTPQIIAELGWSKKVIKDVLGVTPNMMRPPYGDIDDRVRNISIAMGMTPVMWTRISPTSTFNTGDFDVKGGLVSSQQVLANWNTIMTNVTDRSDGFITLQHDLWQQSVELATGYILPDALAHDPPFKIQPVISCLNKPLSAAYIETNDNKTNPPPSQGGGSNTLSAGAPGSAQPTEGTKGGENSAAGGWAGLGFTTLFSGLVAVAAGSLLL